MIRVEVRLVPHGDDRLGSYPLLTGTIGSDEGADGQPAHVYRLHVHAAGQRGHVVEGVVPKTMSGHRNPLHLLSTILRHIDLAGLGADYATTVVDLPADHPRRQRERRNGVADARDASTSLIRALARIGDEGRAALETIQADVALALAGEAPPVGAEGPFLDIDAVLDAHYAPCPGRRSSGAASG